MVEQQAAAGDDHADAQSTPARVQRDAAPAQLADLIEACCAAYQWTVDDVLTLTLRQLRALADARQRRVTAMEQAMTGGGAPNGPALSRQLSQLAGEGYPILIEGSH